MHPTVARRIQSGEMKDPRTGGFWTFVPYMPNRPVSCLTRALIALDRAVVDARHRVEVVVQGPCKHELPDPDVFDFDLHYVHNERNEGNAKPPADSIRRFLDSDCAWWCRLQDDIILADRAWHQLVLMIQQEADRGVRIACAQVSTGNAKWMKPWCFEIKPVPGGVPHLALVEHAHATHSGGWMQWHVAECVGFGSTVIRREPLEEGCIPDERYFVGGVDTDLALQFHAAGYRSILTVDPVCKHIHSQCSTEAYDNARYSKERHMEAWRVWRDKWGMDFEFLRTFGR